LVIEATDNVLLTPELASGIARVKGVASTGVRTRELLSVQQAQKLINAPDTTPPTRRADPTRRCATDPLW
jgi:hypothetical protein